VRQKTVPGDLVEMVQITHQVPYSSGGDWEQVDYIEISRGETGLVLEDSPDDNGNLVIVLFRGLQCMVWRSRLRVIE
jgi:hypothetical protein